MCAFGDEARLPAQLIALRLRKAGMSVATDILRRSPKAQLKEADRSNARYALILGDDELAAQTVTVKRPARRNPSKRRTSLDCSTPGFAMTGPSGIDDVRIGNATFSKWQIKVVLTILGLGIMGAVLYYTKTIVDDLVLNEQRTVELYAKLFTRSAQGASDEDLLYYHRHRVFFDPLSGDRYQ